MAKKFLKDKCKSLAVLTICIDDEPVVGFDEALFKKKLGL